MKFLNKCQNKYCLAGQHLTLCCGEILNVAVALYGILTEQLENVIENEKIDDMRKVMLRKMLPGESSPRIPALM